MNRHPNWLHVVRIAIVSIVLAFVAVVNMPAHAYAAASPTYCDTLTAQQCAEQGAGVANSNTGGVDVNSLVKTIIDILSAVIGIIAIIMVILGALRYVISGGDSNATSSARNTILYALVGLAVAALAQVLVHFVLFKV